MQFRGMTPPRTPPPPPSDDQLLPLCYPETLGTLIEVRESEGKGLGVFALCDTPSGTVLLSEYPLVKLVDTGTRADPLEATIAALSSPQRKSFLSLCSYSRNPNESLHRSIVYSNGYAIGTNDTATGVFETASRINHSCVPNSAYTWKERSGRMVFYNRFKLLEGEEVTVDYGHKKGQLKRIYGFECQCGGCTERGSVRSESRVGSSSRMGSDGGEGEGEREMGSLDRILEEALDGEAVMEELDAIVERVGAIELEAKAVEADLGSGVEGSG